jgi:acyl dehydratase
MRTLAILSLRSWEFRGAVFPGDTIHVISKVLEKKVRGRGRRGEITWQRLIYNQDNKVVQEGISVTLVEGRSGGGTRSEGQGAREDEEADAGRPAPSA